MEIQDKTKSYYFFSIGSFPSGNAATNRALSYMRGLVETGTDVTLYVLAPDNNQSKCSNLKECSYKGIHIQYTSPFLFVKKGILSKVNFCFGILKGFFSLTSVLKKNKGKSPIFLLFTNPILIWFYFIPIKLFGAKVFHERTEFPFLNKKNSLIFNFYKNHIIPRFNGIYVISFALVDYFKTLTSNPILLLPMTVEFDRFANYKKNQNIKYIAYCGSMYTDKDGVLDLIKSFNIIALENNDILLYLIGDNSDQNKFRIIKNTIDESPVKNRIICTGQIERDKMPELLNNAIMLVLCRPANLQAQGGFPTKLGEYLATANPVVITDVGDHTKYLKDRISAFIARPNDPIHFASKMQECLDDPTFALSVGKIGYQVAIEQFNYKTQALMLRKFVEDII